MSQQIVRPGGTPQLIPRLNKFPNSHYEPRLGYKRKVLPAALAFSQPEAFKSRSKNRIGMHFQEMCPDHCSARQAGAPTQILRIAPEIPNVSSATARRTNAANMYVPIKFLFIERMPTNTTTRTPINRDVRDVALCACDKSHQIAIKNPAVRKSSFRLSLPRSSGQVCSRYQKKKKPRIRQIGTQTCFYLSAMPVLNASPVHGSKPRPHCGIVLDKQNGDRNDDVGASFHQSCYRFLRVRFRQDDQRHDRMTENLDPPLESYEGKIGPGNGNETIKQKSDEPAVVPNNF